jgi:hypothetical protein
LSAIPPLYGQFTGALSGTVLDPNGAVVPDASLRLTNTATGVTLTTKSDARGEYHFNSLAPTAYQLDVQMTGFSAAQNRLTLETDQTLNFDVKLAVGSSTQTVQVTTLLARMEHEFPSVDGGLGLVGLTASGWQISGTAILQSGTPFTVSTNAAFNPLTNASGQFAGYAAGSGDYNADEDNFDFPDVASYSMPIAVRLI